MLGQDGHGQAPQHLLGADGHGQYNPQHMLGQDGHGQAPQHLLGADGHGQYNPPHMLGQDGHGQAPPGSRKLLVGGHSEADVESAEVKLAAKAGFARILAMTNSLTPPSLVRIVSATKQVVAGMKYTLVLELSDGSAHRVVVLDQAWKEQRHTVLEHTVL